MILLVPGWNYANNGHVTGSDFTAPRRLLDRLGIENHLLLVPPNGSVMQSAKVIANAILEHGDTAKSYCGWCQCNWARDSLHPWQTARASTTRACGGLGLSLTGNLSSLSSNKYPLIAEQEPNDGLTLLADIIAPNTLMLVATGSDHYFAEDPDISLKTIAMVKTVLNLV